jgi:hypothetical protein
VGVGVQLGPLGTATINRPIVPAPGDYDGGIGGIIGKGNRSTRRNPVPVPLFVHHKLHMLPGREHGLPRRKPATNRLSYGTAYWYFIFMFYSTSYQTVNFQRKCKRLRKMFVPIFIFHRRRQHFLHPWHLHNLVCQHQHQYQ